MKFILAFFILTLPTLVTEKPRSDEKGLFRVVKIQSIHDYYVIYASKDNLKYKIVSKKQSRDGCVKIRRNQEYKFELKELEFLGGSEVNCVSFDKRTIICRCEDEDCAFGLFMTNNLQGLCLIDG